MGHRKKKRTQVPATETKGPKTFIVSRGKVSRDVRTLVKDFRQVMYRHTATNLKESRKNKLKDYISVAGPLGVSHLLVFTETERGTYLKLARLPRGPTITLKVDDFTLQSDIARILPHRHPLSPADFAAEPVLTLGNFDPNVPHLKLASVMFTSMFPAINVRKVVLNRLRRALLLGYDKETKRIEFRHYVITLRPVGVTRSIKRITAPGAQARVPDLSQFNDMSDYVLKNAGLSESEAESDGESRITQSRRQMRRKGASVKKLKQADLPDGKAPAEQNDEAGDDGDDETKVSKAPRHRRAAQQSAVRLIEVGPRLSMTITKIEEELFGGAVMYHGLVHKTQEEILALELRQQERVAEQNAKTLRTKEQEANVKRKLDARERAAKEARRAQGLDVSSSSSSSGGEGHSDSEGGSAARHKRVKFNLDATLTDSDSDISGGDDPGMDDGMDDEEIVSFKPPTPYPARRAGDEQRGKGRHPRGGRGGGGGRGRGGRGRGRGSHKHHQ